MAALGSTTDPKALVPGDPEAVRAEAELVRTLATGLESAADDLAGVRVPSWSGSAADAFWDVMSEQPRSWRVTVDALGEATTAISGFADVLAAAQSSAADAIDRWAVGDRATAEATTAYNTRVATYNSALRTWMANGTGRQPTAPAPFSDPGAADRSEAQAILDEARDSVRRAGDDAASALGRIVISDRPVVSTHSGTDTGVFEGDVSGTLLKIDPETGERKIGLVTADGSATWFTAGAGAESRYGSWFAKADADFYAFRAEGSASAGIKDGTARLEASGSLALLGGSASASAGGEYGHVGAEVDAFAGGYAEAGVVIGAEGVSGRAGAFAGAKVEGSVEAEVAGVGAKASAEGWAGWGVEANFGATLQDDGTWKFGGKAGAAAGFGGSVGFEFTVDPGAVGDALADAGDWLGSLL